jgi:hypothetical protein
MLENGEMVFDDIFILDKEEIRCTAFNLYFA